MRIEGGGKEGKREREKEGERERAHSFRDEKYVKSVYNK